MAAGEFYPWSDDFIEWVRSHHPRAGDEVIWSRLTEALIEQRPDIRRPGMGAIFSSDEGVLFVTKAHAKLIAKHWRSDVRGMKDDGLYFTGKISG